VTCTGLTRLMRAWTGGDGVRQEGTTGRGLRPFGGGDESDSADMRGGLRRAESLRPEKEPRQLHVINILESYVIQHANTQWGGYITWYVKGLEVCQLRWSRHHAGTGSAYKPLADITSTRGCRAKCERTGAVQHRTREMHYNHTNAPRALIGFFGMHEFICCKKELCNPSFYVFGSSYSLQVKIAQVTPHSVQLHWVEEPQV
jgi:hypothetical protein